jgi:hypothetical protein
MFSVRTLLIAVSIFSICELFPVLSFSNDQTTVSPPELASNSASNAGNTAGPVSLMSNREFWLSMVILFFGIVIIIIEYFLLRTVVAQKTEEIARIYTVTLIIIGTLVLIASGFTNEQIAPALGLFGTIAGYLLGRHDYRRRGQSNNEKGEEDD